MDACYFLICPYRPRAYPLQWPESLAIWLQCCSRNWLLGFPQAIYWGCEEVSPILFFSLKCFRCLGEQHICARMESARGNARSEWSVRVILYLCPLVAQPLSPQIDKDARRFHLCDHELYCMRRAVCTCHDIRNHPNAPLGCCCGVLLVRLVWSFSA